MTQPASPATASGSDRLVRVFWRPGCSSCAKVKDYLNSRGIDFISVNVAVDRDAMTTLATLGIRSVPVVMRGTEFSFAQSLEDVARFLNLPTQAVERLSPAELIDRWIYFLGAGKALAMRVPADRWLFAPQLEVSIQSLTYHALRIPLAFLACVEDGVQDWVRVAMEPPSPETRHEELARLADEAVDRVNAWWAALPDKTCAWPVAKYDGTHSAHVFLERQVWHSAHHLRQVADALTQLGVDARDVIDPAKYVGLPMPDRIW
ncbi:MAG TPA: glutaredoxin domain-containing protein [Steroidobacter sp.]